MTIYRRSEKPVVVLVPMKFTMPNHPSLLLLCLLLRYSKLSVFHPSIVSATLSKMPHRIYSSSPSQEQKRSFRHIPPPNQSICSPYMPESRRKHALAPFRPFGRSTSSQSSMSKSDDEYSSTTRCPSRLSTSEEATTLEKIWGSLFDEDGQPTARLVQLLRGLAMHIVGLGS